MGWSSGMSGSLCDDVAHGSTKIGFSPRVYSFKQVWEIGVK
jgi:hypothetical protein